MELKEDWFERQIEAVKNEIKTWSHIKREVMFCCGGHDWQDSNKASQTQEVQTCKDCGRQRIKFIWAESWTMVKRGSEVDWCK